MLGNLASNKTTLLIYPSSRPPTLLSLSLSLGKAIALFTSSPLSSIMKRFGISKKKKKRERDSILYKLFTLRRTLDILIPQAKIFLIKLHTYEEKKMPLREREREREREKQYTKHIIISCWNVT